MNDSAANNTAATTPNPYVVTRLSWLAVSRRSFGTRLGMDASLAGIQNRLLHSIRKDATNSHQSVSINGMETKSPKRRKSVTIIVVRRSKRSANAPAIGPNTSAGINRTKSTTAIA
jgi:hypothetical protein